MLAQVDVEEYLVVVEEVEAELLVPHLEAVEAVEADLLQFQRHLGQMKVK